MKSARGSVTADLPFGRVKSILGKPKVLAHTDRLGPVGYSLDWYKEIDGVPFSIYTYWSLDGSDGTLPEDSLEMDFRFKGLADPETVRSIVTKTFGVRPRRVSKTAAGKPYMHEITRRKYRAGEAFMAYYIDAAKNHSKFYEMVVVPDPSGMGATLKKKWGALGQGRHRDKAEFFEDIETAKRAMSRHGQAKLRKGYKDAFKSNQGQYPVGLDRTVGFGWGTQAITQCVPALRDMSALISKALLEARDGDAEDLLMALESMAVLLGDIPDSMSGEVAKRMRGPLQRMKKNPRFIDDPNRTQRELLTLKRYIDRQISECV